MIDPERLLDTDLQDAASLRERELLGSLKPSTGTRAAVWGRIVAQGVVVAGATATAATATVSASASSVEVAAAGAATGATSAVAGAGSVTAGSVSATTGVMGSLAAKAGMALIVAAPVLGGTVYLTQGGAQREQPAATPTIEVPSQATPLKSTSVEPSKEEATVAAPESTKHETVSSSAVAVPSQANADALREENRLLREARALERAGNPGQALRILAELDRLFARGALLQEREILRIQSLSASGSASAAKTRAEQFLKRYPASPYAAHVRSILDESSPSP